MTIKKTIEAVEAVEAVEERSNDETVTVLNTTDSPRHGISAGGTGEITFGEFKGSVGLRLVEE